MVAACRTFFSTTLVVLHVLWNLLKSDVFSQWRHPPTSYMRSMVDGGLGQGQVLTASASGGLRCAVRAGERGARPSPFDATEYLVDSCGDSEAFSGERRRLGRSVMLVRVGSSWGRLHVPRWWRFGMPGPGAPLRGCGSGRRFARAAVAVSSCSVECVVVSPSATR